MEKIWKSRIARKIKIRFFQACVESILLYGSETWTVSAELKARIDGCYTRLLRRALNIRWQDHPTNQMVYQDLPKLSDKLKERRLRYAGHCARAEDQPVNQLLFWTPHLGNPSRGQPRLTYPKTLKNDTGLENPEEILELMRNKETWSTFVLSNSYLSTDDPPMGVR